MKESKIRTHKIRVGEFEMKESKKNKYSQN